MDDFPYDISLTQTSGRNRARQLHRRSSKSRVGADNVPLLR